MRSFRFGLFVVLLISAPAQSQNTQPPDQQTPTAQPTVDPQATSVLNQALSAAGGVAAIAAVSDYTATGAVTYTPAKQKVQGTVTIHGNGISQFRMDSNLSGGVRTWIISKGQITRKVEDGKIWRGPPSEGITPSNFFPYQMPMFPAGLFTPLLQLASVLNNPNFNIFYKGIVEVGGQSVHDIQVQRFILGSSTSATPFNTPAGYSSMDPKHPLDNFGEHNSVDFFIAVSNFQVLMIQDVIPRHIVHRVWYSDYRNASGILMPFSVSDQAGGQTTWTIQLDQIILNQGLQDSDFTL